MTLLLSALAFFILLSVLILIHEWGHFAAARKAGVVVEEFGFGLPPRAKTLFFGRETRFSLNWIPFGGFVRLKGENALTEEERTAPGSFGAAPIPARIVILVAGVAMNFILALAILTVGFSFFRWIPTYTSFEEMRAAADRGEIQMMAGVLVDEVFPDGTAFRAGVPARSMLIAVDGEPVRFPEEVSPLQEGKRRVVYTLLVGDDFSEERTIPVSLNEEGKTGIGIVPFPRDLAAPARNLLTGFLLSLRESYVVTTQTVIGIGKLFLSLAQTGTVPEGISGIVGIAQMTHMSVQAGFTQYLRLVAILSLSLAILNILPFPALDGGRLAFILLEVIQRRPVNRRIEVLTNALGFVFLILLILFITFNDIARLF